jgi:hypothetical protein
MLQSYFAVQAHNWKTAARTPCGDAMDRLEAAMGPINKYDILGPCFFPGDNQAADSSSSSSHSSSSSSSGSSSSSSSSGDSSGSSSSSSRRAWPYAPAFPSAEGRTSKRITNWYAAQKATSSSSDSSSSSSGMLGHTISCADRRHAVIYNNSPTVRAALHAGTFQQVGR